MKKPHDIDQELKATAKRLADLSHMLYAWKDFLYRLKNGVSLPVSFQRNDDVSCCSDVKKEKSEVWKPFKTAPVCQQGCHWFRARGDCPMGPPEAIICLMSEEEKEAYLNDGFYKEWMPCEYRREIYPVT